MEEKEIEKKPIKDKKKKKKAVLLLLLLLLLGIAGGIIYYLQMNPKSPLTRDEDALGGILPGKTPDEIQGLLNEKVAEGMINIGILAEPVFEKGGKKGKLGIENTPGNQYSFQINLELEDTKEILYRSGLIDPGYYVEYIELNKTLPEGTYPATAIFTTYSLEETEEPIATTKVKVNLIIRDGTIYQ